MMIEQKLVTLLLCKNPNLCGNWYLNIGKIAQMTLICREFADLTLFKFKFANMTLQTFES